MQLTFWGVRGSIPTPDARMMRWGGNTACLEVRRDGHPPLVLDCGTGARGLGAKLVGEAARELDLLFTHLHMDHLFGLPFFFPVYTPAYDVRITVPAYSDDEARDKVARFLNGTFHPVRIRELPSAVTFHAIRPGPTVHRAGFEVTTCALNHPGGSLGYRVACADGSVVYVTDTAPFARPGEGVMAGDAPTPGERRLLDLLHGADLVIYDTMYTRDEYLERMTWGHSYPEYAVALCTAAGVRHLALFHHAPTAVDDVLDAQDARWRGYQGPLEVFLAREGDTLTIGGSP